MKILCISNLYPPYKIGGYEALAERTMQGLKEHGHEIHVATGKGPEFESATNIHDIYELDLVEKKAFFTSPCGLREFVKRNVYDRIHYRRTRDLIRELQPDFISMWNLSQLSLSPMIAARDSRIPNACHVSDSWMLPAFGDIWNRIANRKGLRGGVDRYAAGFIRRAFYLRVRPQNLIVPSHSMQQTYTAEKFGFPDKIFHRIPHGTRIDQFFPRPETVPKKPTDPIRLLYAGQLWQGKGGDVLLRALGSLIQKGQTHFRLDIYGTGTDDFLNYMRSIVDEEDLSQFVNFCGTVDYSDLADVYRNHDLMIFPSIWNEPFALAPIESMACGTPVIGTSAGGTPEAIDDGETGFIVPPNDPKALAEAIQVVIDDPSLLERLSQRAAEAVPQRFGFEHYLDQVETFYRGLSESRKRSIGHRGQ